MMENDCKYAIFREYCPFDAAHTEENYKASIFYFKFFNMRFVQGRFDFLNLFLNRSTHLANRTFMCRCIQ